MRYAQVRCTLRLKPNYRFYLMQSKKLFNKHYKPILETYETLSTVSPENKQFRAVKHLIADQLQESIFAEVLEHEND